MQHHRCLLIPPSLLSLLTLLFYYPSLRYPFLFDDLPNITKCYEIRFFHQKNLWFANTRWISRLLNQWTYHHWKLNPFAYRLTNLLIHLIIGIILFYLVLLLCTQAKKTFLQNNKLAFATLTSGLFLLHPVQTQTVTYITQMRIEGLVTLFSSAIIFVFVLATMSNTRWIKTMLYIVAGLLTIFAAGTKEIIVVLPFLLMLIDWFFLAQGNSCIFFKRLPLHLFFALTLYTTFLWLGSPIKPTDAFSLNINYQNNRGNILTTQPEELITPLRYLSSQFKVIVHYIFIFFWPVGITFDYGWKIPHAFWSIECLLPLAFLLILLITSLILFIRNTTNIFSFCIAWFFIAILPRSSIIPSTELVCDYKTYLASFGVLVGITYGLIVLFKKVKVPYYLSSYAISGLLVISLGFASQIHNRVWSSRTAFWGDVIEKTKPHVPARAYNNYAVGLVQKGKIIEGIDQYKKAIKTDPTYAEPHINLALQYQVLKDYKKSLEHYKIALQLKEVHPETYNNLGLLNYARKDFHKAIQSFSLAIKLRPYYSKALLNLGRTHQAEKQYDKALVYYEKALQGDFQNYDSYYLHGSLAYFLQKYKPAIASLEQVEVLKGDYKNTGFMLGNSYYYTNQFDKAEPYLAQVYRKEPSNVSYCYNYAQTLLKQKKFKEALPLFLRCKHYPQLIHASLHFATCLHQTGNAAQAQEELKRFIVQAPTSQLKNMGIQVLKEIG